MSLILSERALLTSQGEGYSSNLTQIDSYKLLIPSPEQVSSSSSRGYKRSVNLRHGLNLLIRDYWLQDVLIEENLPDSPGLTLEFGFNLFGDDLDDEQNSSVSNSFLQFADNSTEVDFQEWQIKGKVVKIDLHLKTPNGSQTFSQDQLDLIPAELQDLTLKSQEHWFTSLGTIAPNIQLVLQQIINCPYTGSIRQVYLEGKSLELIALQSARFLQSDQSGSRFLIKRSDVERIYQARELVTQQLENPPSLIDLAHAVGLNDCTLKRGFRQVFGTVQLKPDLILGTYPKEMYSQLSRIAPTVIFWDGDENYQRWQDGFRAYAEALGKTQEADRILNEYQQRVRQFQAGMGDRLAIQVSLVNFFATDVRIYFKQCLGGQILEEVGLSRPPFQDKDDWSIENLSLEAIPQMAGDVIFLILGGHESSKLEQFTSHPLWSGLEAVQKGRVYEVNNEIWIAGATPVDANLLLDDLFKALMDHWK